MARTITRPQARALRDALDAGQLTAPDFPAGHPLHDRYSLTVDTRTNTRDALVRLGMVEAIAHDEHGETVTDYVLTYAGELVAVHCGYSGGADLPPLDIVANYVANAVRPPVAEARPSNGYYYPNEAGARTLAESRALWLAGKRVTASVGDDGTHLYVWLGGEMIFDGDMPSGINTSGDVNPWVRQYATGYVWAEDFRTLWSYTTPDGLVAGPYSDAAFRHTDESAERYCRGIVDTVGAGKVIRIDRRPERFETVGRNWTDMRTVVHALPAPQEAPDATTVRADELTPGMVVLFGSAPARTVESVRGNDAARNCSATVSVTFAATDTDASWVGLWETDASMSVRAPQGAQEAATVHGLEVVSMDEVLTLLGPLTAAERVALEMASQDTPHSSSDNA